MAIGAEFFRAVLESTADGILVVDETGKVITSNGRFAELWRLPPDLLARGLDEELIAFVLEQLADPTAFTDRIRSLYGSREEELDVIPFQDGRIFERFSAPLIRGEEVVGRVWSFRDVTATRKTEVALRRSEERFRTLYNLTPVMLHSIDADWKIVEVNEHWLERMGYTRDEVIGRSGTSFLSEESKRQAEGEGLPKFVKEGIAREVPHQFVTKDGEVFDTLLTSMAQYDEDGAFARSFACIVDVSERKRAEEERQRLERQILHAQKLESLGVLAGGIAHDFNNLLVSILGNADLALAHQAAGTPAHELIEEVVGAGQQAADLCRQLLAYSGSGRFRVEAIDLSELAQEMIHLLEVSIPKRVALRCEFEPDLPAVEVDVNQIRQVLMNLITNAGEAIGEEEGEIVVEIRKVDCDERTLSTTMFAEDVKPGPYVLLKVSDTGDGMAAETKQRIFDPFFSSKATGRGLGLAATLGIVRGHGGTLSVDSAPGEGANFRILIPASELPTVSIRRADSRDNHVGAEELVLVVDDEEGVRKVSRRILERAGFRVLIAERGEHALEIQEERADELAVVVLDLMMPGMGGEATLRALRQKSSDLAIVLSSGYDAEAAMQRLTGADRPDSFVHKPYRRQELVHAVLEALKARVRGS